MGTFAEYRDRVAERERKLEAEYSAKIISLSEEVLAAKKDFEERMKQFQALQEKFEREKEAALEKLRQEHQREIQLLEQRCSEAQLLNLEQKYIIEIKRLEEERKSLRTEKEKMNEAFEDKFNRAQTLYESELSTAKSLYSKELEALSDHEKALKEELRARQEEFKDRFEESLYKLQQTEEELKACKAEISKLNALLQSREQEIESVTKQLDEAWRTAEETAAKLKCCESDLETTKQKSEKKQDELTSKNEQISLLDCQKNKLTSTVQDLQSELKSLKNKVTFLENERQNLEGQSQTQAQLQNSQLKALEMVLENVSKEKESLRASYEQQIEEERIAAEEREFELKKEYTTKLCELERQNKTFQENLDNRSRLEKEQLRQELLAANQEALSQLKEENAALTKDVQQLKQKIADSEEHVKEVAEKQQTLMDAQAMITSLNQRIAELQQNCDEQQLLIEDFKQNMMNLPAEMEAGSCGLGTTDSKLLEEVDRRVKKEKEKWLEESELKTQEVRRAVRDEYEFEIANLKKELDEKGAIVEELRSKNGEAMQQQQELFAQVSAFTAELDNSAVTAAQYENVLDQLQEEQESRTKLAKEFKEYRLSISDLIGAQKSEIDELTLVIATQRERLSEIEPLEKKLNELRNVHADCANHEKVCKELQIEACREEMRNMVEKIRLMEIESQAEVRKLETEIRKKDKQLSELNHKLTALTSTLDEVNKELDLKMQEILNVRNETQEYIRRREQQQMMSHMRDMNSLKQEYETRLHKQNSVDKSSKRELNVSLAKVSEVVSSCERTEEMSNAESKASCAATLEDGIQSKYESCDKSSTRRRSVPNTKELRHSCLAGQNAAEIWKKRTITSHNCSAKTPNSICRKANMSVICKWKNLVSQVTSANIAYKDGQGGTKPAKTIPSLSKNAPSSQDARDKGSLTSVSSSDAAKDSGKMVKRLLSSTKSSDSSCSGTSTPVRSPVLRVKSQQRPAWRL